MKLIYQGSKSVSYLGPKIWEIVPAKKKETKKTIPSTVSKEKSVSGYHEIVLADFANNILVVLVFPL